MKGGLSHLFFKTPTTIFAGLIDPQTYAIVDNFERDYATTAQHGESVAYRSWLTISHKSGVSGLVEYFSGWDLRENRKLHANEKLGKLASGIGGTSGIVLTVAGPVKLLTPTKIAPKSLANGTADVFSGAQLKQHLRHVEKHGKGGFKQLENGRFRYYGKFKPADKVGEYAGARMVREWDPSTGNMRLWYECIDHAGNVRSIAPKPPTHPLNHHVFDASGTYIGRR